jgi:hypothetical protein
MRLGHWFYILPLRLRSIFRSRQVERDLDEEFPNATRLGGLNSRPVSLDSLSSASL